MATETHRHPGKPRCPKCGGTALNPERSIFSDRVESVGCITCGERLYRNHPRRLPTTAERGSHGNAYGIPHRKGVPA